MSARAPSLAKDTAGAIYVEFLLCFMPIFMMFLAMVQLSLMYVAHLVVQHSAYTATRAAIVVIDDDPQYYESATRDNVTDPGSGPTVLDDRVANVLNRIGFPLEASPRDAASMFGGNNGNARLGDIRRAAQIPLIAVSPAWGQFTENQTVARAVGGGAASRATLGALFYSRVAVGVTFPTRPGATTYRTSFAGSDTITVRVTYLFHCAVPIVAELMCKSIEEIKGGTLPRDLADLAERAASAGDWHLGAELASRIRNHEGMRSATATSELDAAQDPWALWILNYATHARFKLLRAEATLPIQRASYRYQSEASR